ncbi:hypothetical protein [Actinoallomurus sp. NPDC052274]|uniref:hypothetical protein n=1 Tax=Actinoallomurus sp. NPDC052274 TaxID=3155420 RepID=UPI00342BA433
MGVQILDELLAGRGRHSESHIWLDTHHAFGVTPTCFTEFAKRDAKALLGRRTEESTL